MYLLDTNICIFAIRGNRPALSQRLLSIHPREICVSAITVGELEYGAVKSRWSEQTRYAFHALLASYTVLPFTESDAIVFARIRAALASSGLPIGAYDMMIGAQGVARGYTVVTHNTREFIRIPGIQLEDWSIGESLNG